MSFDTGSTICLQLTATEKIGDVACRRTLAQNAPREMFEGFLVGLGEKIRLAATNELLEEALAGFFAANHNLDFLIEYVRTSSVGALSCVCGLVQLHSLVDALVRHRAPLSLLDLLAKGHHKEEITATLVTLFVKMELLTIDRDRIAVESNMIQTLYNICANENEELMVRKNAARAIYKLAIGQTPVGRVILASNSIFYGLLRMLLLGDGSVPEEVQEQISFIVWALARMATEPDPVVNQLQWRGVEEIMQKYQESKISENAKKYARETLLNLAKDWKGEQKALEEITFLTNNMRIS